MSRGRIAKIGTWGLIVAIAAGAPLSACGGGGDSSAQVKKWCADVAGMPTILTTASSVAASGTYGQVQTAQSQIAAEQQALKADAPSSIRSKVATVLDTPSETTSASAAASAANARTEVNAFIRAKCDLTTTL